MGLRIATVRGPSMVPALRDGDRVLVRLGAGTPRVGRVVLVELPDRPLSVKRLVAIARGKIGRPDSRASRMTPRPATRATFGTSAVVAMLMPSASVCSMRLNAVTPPLR